MKYGTRTLEYFYIPYILLYQIDQDQDRMEVEKIAENCECKNKEYVYVCNDDKCTPVEKAPKCFTQKSTFYKVD